MASYASLLGHGDAALMGVITILGLIVGFGLGAATMSHSENRAKEDRFVLISRDRVTGLCYAKGQVNGPVACGD